MTHLLLTVRFLDDRYHGLLARGGPPEWPPSPFRLFCALVVGVARRGELDGDIGSALSWLQTLDAPLIIAPRSMGGQPITRHVPNNDGDREFDRQERLQGKPTRPTLMLLGEDEKPEVHYLWKLAGKGDVPLERIREAARTLSALGWGIDMAFADAATVAEADIRLLPGVRWYPKPHVWREDGMLRVPMADRDLRQCTLCDLKHCHETAIARIEHGKPLKSVDEPSVFDRVFYASSERPIGRPARVFKLVDADGDTVRRRLVDLKRLAGMVRCIAIRAMASKALLEKLHPDHDQLADPFHDGSPPPGIPNPDRWVETYIAGHRADDADDHRQLSYLPLPSIGHIHSDLAIRRVMIAAPIGDDAWLEHIASRLNGRLLKPLDRTPLPSPTSLCFSRNDTVGRFYTAPSNEWHSVTPVILPGHDDHKPTKTRKLIEKALWQSGIEQPCEFEWSAYSKFPKSFTAHKYGRDGRPSGYLRPDHLMSNTAVHLTVRFKEGIQVPGPLVIGAGRHCGFGLMAALPSH